MRRIKTRFRYAYTYRLKLARETKSMTHYTKGTPSQDWTIITTLRKRFDFKLVL